jgi:hypothetical protein
VSAIAPSSNQPGASAVVDCELACNSYCRFGYAPVLAFDLSSTTKHIHPAVVSVQCAIFPGTGLHCVTGDPKARYGNYSRAALSFLLITAPIRTSRSTSPRTSGGR